MTEAQDILPAETAGTAVTRFNALKHGVLSRYTVLPWEDADEYRVQASFLADEHRPQGPTEEHLVEELAGWPLGREISGHRTELAAQLGTRLALLCLPRGGTQNCLHHKRHRVAQRQDPARCPHPRPLPQ